MARDFASDLVCKALGHRRFEYRGQPLLRIRRGTPDQQARRIHFHPHFGEAQLYGLELDDRLAELLAFLHVDDDVFEGAGRLRQSHRRVSAPLEIESFHQLLEPPRGDDDVTCRHFAAIEIEVG